MRRPSVAKAIASGGLFAITLAARLDHRHSALLYPDGYQYLLMARGIGEHLRPTTVMGPGGDLFVPSADAAAKPLYPLLVCAAHVFGASWLGAAELVTAVAAAATVAIAFLLVLRLSGSWLAGAATALLLLASSTLTYWAGFPGPDPLAQALGLAAVLAFLERRPVIGGILLGLAAASRPELALLGLVALVVLVRKPEHRASAFHGAVACASTLVLVYVVLRPPVALPDVELLVLGAVLVAVIALADRVLAGRVNAVVAILGVALLMTLGSATSQGLRELWGHDRWVLGAGVVGLGIAVLGSRRDVALRVLVVGALLGGVYWAKNPGSERYFSIVLPLVAAILAGLGVAELARLRRSVQAPVLGAVAIVGVVGVLGLSTANYEQDVFSRTAERLAPVLGRADPLVTAAPDAYSFWLPAQRVRTMRPGVRGLILLDPAQRAYAPRLGARGKVVARLVTDFAFFRPDGAVDTGDAVLVAGRVTDARPREAAALGAP